MVRITYSKYFLTGTLAGLSVTRQGFTVPAADAHKRMMELMRNASRTNPGRDLITGSQYYVYNVGSEAV